MPFSKFQKQLWLSSVPLVRLNEQRLPTGIASGCLIDYSGRRLLLTVSHATGDQANWAIQQKYVPGKGTCNYQLGAMNFLARATLSNPKLEDVDFSYVEVPSSFIAFRQEIEVPGNSVKSETPINVHSPSLLDEPDENQEYGFCGMVMPASENHFGQVYFGGELRVYDRLSFLRTEDDYHFFKLPFSHPGHEHFQGCSGAPIIDKSGNLVALVCGGCEDTSEVYGISVRAYKTPVDILVGNVS
ncbi:hypothetical protein [Halomonas sp. BM-2019]|uniref:hypothetical protein n=1 Tax=Halomonas sp. BM-2019 TaxID=2811227 RepID=UPI001B3C3193|nr:MAG: hypothetical protein J5F18_06780 [Halomonas sp. BM-2019]